MEENRGILFLSHQGFSFIEDLTRIAGKLGFESYLLSSKPNPQSLNRIEHIHSLGHWLRVSKKDSLSRGDVLGALTSLKESGKKVLACMTVWEGYRLLMSDANSILKANDESSETIQVLLDKYRLRQSLRKAGLSKVRSRILTKNRFESLSKENQACFVKPRSGLGSFGAFRIDDQTTWQQILKLKREMVSDREYASVFESSRDFIVEDYIGGVELSFETLVVEGEAHFPAIHEKLETEQMGCSTMENTSVSPPVSLEEAGVRSGMGFIQSCLQALGIRTGCYHIEAKYLASTNQWEVIEINPRLGGALIKESVFELTEGVELIEEWMRIILSAPRYTKQLKLRASQSSPVGKQKTGPKNGTFFRVYFGEPGRTVKEIGPTRKGPAPHIIKVAVKNGTQLSDSSHEIFLGQALWKFPISEFGLRIPEILKLSKETLEVKYA